MTTTVQDQDRQQQAAPATNAPIERSAAYYRLKADVEDFYYHEADLLDDRRFRDWLELLTDDISYFMPIRRNVKFGQQAARENTKRGEGISWFDEDKWTLTKRVEQILTGVHYAEEPLSRITHMVSNVQIKGARPQIDAARELDVTSRFLVYQNRVEYETYIFVGRRNDTLRLTDNGWKIARREILLEQNILLAKNLTTFF
ncbi:3-phenylpropionate/cinnamic acid dioxygenase subunit beta [Bradyrhizobium tropiciagri]|uniref:3-phenylpropionate/cinnamic acid dioxygenase subunit beta n=1 Tax=Bradyrhizobium tropiciagri TaxID=312253 RepID=UPI001BABE854|nr:3-phenylpropionate/cinnamic acid dioxygenase subunit beta [Bradyrhizobium tropiciagri]MBR0899911.1 3-phenylpropionate/cinnamic acid dioxygenase subunit beta [Bradyrhizobium tropiciagri]